MGPSHAYLSNNNNVCARLPDLRRCFAVPPKSKHVLSWHQPFRDHQCVNNRNIPEKGSGTIVPSPSNIEHVSTGVILAEQQKAGAERVLLDLPRGYLWTVMEQQLGRGPLVMAVRECARARAQVAGFERTTGTAHYISLYRF